MNVFKVLSILLEVFGGLGLFLLGMRNLSEGLQAVAGNRLRRMIAAVTDNRVLGVMTGTVVTMLVQSSSITTVMVVGLVSAGFMTLVQAVGVIMGANIGTTLTGWLVAMLPKVGQYGLPLLGISAIFHLFSRRERARYGWLTVVGLGMIFFGLSLMSEGLKPLRGEPAFIEVFKMFRADGYFGVLKCVMLGCLMTFLVQSSSATLAVTMNLALNGMIDFQTAGALVLGENVGTTITAYLASLGGTTEARRAAYAHILFNLFGVLWVSFLFLPVIVPTVYSIMGEGFKVGLADETGLLVYPHIMAPIAAVHTLFNVTNTLLFMPFIPAYSRLIKRLVPSREMEETPHLTYLDTRMVDSPAIAVEQAREQVIGMGKIAMKALTLLGEALEKDDPDPDLERRVFRKEEVLDNIQHELSAFLGKALQGHVPRDAQITARNVIRLADEVESVSDEVAQVLKMKLRMRKNQLVMSEAGQRDLLDLHKVAYACFENLVLALEYEDQGAVKRAHGDCANFGHRIKDVRRRHMQRLERREVDPMKSLVYMDMLSAYRRMKEEMINIAEVIAGEK